SHSCFRAPPPPEHYTLSLHDALPIYIQDGIPRQHAGVAIGDNALSIIRTAEVGIAEVLEPAAKREAKGQPVSSPERRGVLGVEGDRKSSRLISSHVKIAYAVFCLKKK